ncbi:MAG TPA: hypothetical protein VJT73_11530 [Polyangiaceae bacterium]|nr:hypothetical protein [Polyangiaceae bacterium]
MDLAEKTTAVAFGRIWATFVLEEHLAKAGPIPVGFPGDLHDAWLLAGRVTDDPTRRKQLTAVIRGQAEQSWHAMTRYTDAPSSGPSGHQR